jgi:hypothetical protein
MSTICDPGRVTRKLAQQIIRRGEEPADVLPDLRGVETRPQLRKSAAADDDNWNTSRAYAAWLRRYQAWCPGMGYQSDPARITDARIAEFVATLIEGVDPYMPKSAHQAVSALLHWAGRAAATPAPTGREARDVVNTFAARVRAKGLLPG